MPFDWHINGVVRSSRGSVLAVDLHRLDEHELSAGYRAWLKGGATSAARAERRRTADAIKAALPLLHASIVRGDYEFSLPTPTLLRDGRLVAALNVNDKILVGALVAPFHRHPRLPDILPNAYAYAPEGRGASRLVMDLVGGVRRAAAEHGAVEVAGADIVKCFPSLSPEAALTHARALGFSSWRCDVLSNLYRFWTTAPEFTGLVPGPSSSCFLSELALRPLDLLLAGEGTPYRYSDNIYFFSCGGVPVLDGLKQKVAIFNQREGLDLHLHHEQVTSYTPEKGFTDEFDVLGFRLKGHEVRPHPARVQRCRAKVIAAESDTEAGCIVQGFSNYFADGGVPRARLEVIASDLMQSRREAERDRRYSREAETTQKPAV